MGTLACCVQSCLRRNRCTALRAPDALSGSWAVVEAKVVVSEGVLLVRAVLLGRKNTLVDGPLLRRVLLRRRVATNRAIVWMVGQGRRVVSVAVNTMGTLAA